MGQDIFWRNYPDTLFVEGVPVYSRYNHDEEHKEMSAFVEKAASVKMHTFLDGLFYDSKASASMCFIYFKEGTIETEVADLLLFAKATISQFAWFGCIYHKE